MQTPFYLKSRFNRKCSQICTLTRTSEEVDGTLLKISFLKYKIGRGGSNYSPGLDGSEWYGQTQKIIIKIFLMRGQKRYVLGLSKVIGV